MLTNIGPSEDMAMSTKLSQRSRTDQTDETTSVRFSNLALQQMHQPGMSRMQDMSARVITFDHGSSIEAYNRERTRKRNEAMKRQMSHFLLHSRV